MVAWPRCLLLEQTTGQPPKATRRWRAFPRLIQTGQLAPPTQTSCLFTFLSWFLGIVSILPSARSATSEELYLPDNPADSVIGQIAYTTVREGDTLLDIARMFDLGHDQIIVANPGVNRWIPSPGSEVLLPHRYILPPGRREGLVLNLAELRLYYFPAGGNSVFTYPVSIGDLDWKTPLGRTKIARKDRNPAWFPPQSIRAEHLEEGEELPPMIAGGDPDNPLGQLALRLGIKGYLIHGTDERRSFGIGMRVSHGCIRMYPEDIQELFDKVAVNTPVRIIDEPIKIGWKDELLYLEVHRPLELDDAELNPQISFEELVRLLRKHLLESDEIDQREALRAFSLGNGIPIGVALRQTWHG